MLATCVRFLYLLDLHLERHIFFSDEVVVVENTEGEDPISVRSQGLN